MSFHFVLKGMRLTTEHILLLISATGEFIYLYFGIFAATAAFNREKLELIMGHAHNTTQEITNQKIFVAENALTFVMNSIDIAQIAIQTFALMIATSNLTFNWNVNDPQRVKHYITEVLYYLCVCNGAKWVTDSFIEGHYLRSSEAKILVFGDTTWTGITQTTYPLVLFYRFHSVHMTLKVIDKINNE